MWGRKALEPGMHPWGVYGRPAAIIIDTLYGCSPFIMVTGQSFPIGRLKEWLVRSYEEEEKAE